MLKRGSVVKALLIAVGLLVLLPAAMAAAPAEPVWLAQELMKLPPAQEDTVLAMSNSYEWTDQGLPAQCPDPAVFRNGTRVVYSYIPAYLNQDTSIVVLWYELDENGDPTTEEPIASAQGVLLANTIPNASLSFNKGAKGLVGAYMFVETDGEWVLLATALYGIAYPGVKTPEPGPCPLPEETPSVSTGTGAGNGTQPDGAGLNISWSPQMTYEGRQGDSRWCQVSMTYQNNSGAPYNWPDYRPAVLILNADGSQDGWYYANYYSKEEGWENGISGTPPPIAAGASADWTWYSATGRAGQYCGAVAISHNGWVYIATYTPQGGLDETGVYPPE